LQTYSIIEENCTGCGRCFNICPNNAISIVDRKAHIDHDKCNNCGKCIESCRDNAIAMTTKSLQRTESSVQDIEKTFDQEPMSVRPSTKSGLLAGVSGLFLNTARYLMENYGSKSSQSNLPKVDFLNMQNRSFAKRRCKRIRRGRCGRGGRRFWP
jgi:ferredoxin